MLPIIKKVPLQEESFPQRWQTVIFRNYGLVETERLAKTLSTSAECVEREAKRLGLENTYNPKWEQKGFITLIRNNWFLLPYSQIQTLLGYDEARLDFILTNEDFLSVKLGDFKPECEEVAYAPLTEEEIAVTQRLAVDIKRYLPQTESYFEFFPKRRKERGRYAFTATESVCFTATLLPAETPLCRTERSISPIRF